MLLAVIYTLTLSFTVLLLATISFVAHFPYWCYFDPLLGYVSSSNLLEGVMGSTF